MAECLVAHPNMLYLHFFLAVEFEHYLKACWIKVEIAPDLGFHCDAVFAGLFDLKGILQLAPFGVGKVRADVAEIYQALVLGTRDYVKKNAFEKTVLGLSGGIDSSLVATLLARRSGVKLRTFTIGYGDDSEFDETVYAGEEIFFSQRLKQWARKHRMKFKILTASPVVTSARKMEWYDSWQLLGCVLRMMIPGAMKRRESGGLWYSRPVGGE